MTKRTQTREGRHSSEFWEGATVAEEPNNEPTRKVSRDEEILHSVTDIW